MTLSSTPSSEYVIKEDSVNAKPVLILYRRDRPIMTIWIGDVFVQGVHAEDVRFFYPEITDLMITLQSFHLPYRDRKIAIENLIKEKLNGLRANQ